MKVLVTDGDQRAALAVTRALGRAGMVVDVGDAQADCLAGASRYCRASFAYPSPYTDEDGFVEAIAGEARRREVDIVVPVSDIASAILAEHKGDVGAKPVIAVVDAEVFWRASDKNSLHHLADELGVPTPTLFYLNNATEAEAILDRIPFPCIVKPARSRLRDGNRWLATTVRRVASADELRTLLREQRELQFPFMIQREVAGEGQAVFLLCDHGRPLVSFAHRRVREKPPWGGVSVLRESMAADPRMEVYAKQLLSAVGWHGVAMVEFRVDADTRVPYLMEINGRFWGSLQLAIDAGVNFPLMHVQLFAGEPVTSVERYRTGIRSRWLLGDLDHLLARFSRNGRRRSGGLQGLRSLLWDFAKFVRRDTYYEIESWDDPGPSMHEIGVYLRTGLTALFRHARGGL